jgi:phosphatidylserine/phosphatidylglycerophosphate/cardiolipin synthase-like enzyme
MFIVTDDFIKQTSLILEGSRQYFYIASYVITAPSEKDGAAYRGLWDAIRRACERGVQLRIFCDSGASSSFVTDWNLRNRKLINIRGLEVRGYARSQRMHAKFWVCDNEACYVGSHNLTHGGTFINSELGLIQFNSEIASQLTNIHRLWWGRGNVA